VATPPQSAAPPAEPPARPRYTGPPRYRALPRWGFPAKAWTSPRPEGPSPRDPLLVARSVLGTLVPLLWATASVALLASAAETWRYVLLLASRSDALPAPAVRMSDAFVVAAGTVAPIVGIAAGGLLVLWAVRAAQAAAERSGVRPARSTRAIVLGWVVPGLNLVVPGSVLAEVEHCALDRPPEKRPRPSRLLLVWWVLWGANVLLVALIVTWSLRDGVQARADGVVLHALLNAVAAVAAGVTAVLVTRLTRLLAPPRAVRREVLLAVSA